MLLLVSVIDLNQNNSSKTRHIVFFFNVLQKRLDKRNKLFNLMVSTAKTTFFKDSFEIPRESKDKWTKNTKTKKQWKITIKKQAKNCSKVFQASRIKKTIERRTTNNRIIFFPVPNKDLT